MFSPPRQAITYLLNLRLRMAGRWLSDLGIFRAIFLLTIGLFGLLMMAARLPADIAAHILSGLAALSLFSLHQTRRDHRFLQTAGLGSFTLYATEYVCLALPFSIGIAFTQNPWLTPAPVLAAVCVAALPRRYFRKRLRLHLRRIPGVPPVALEWKAGFRLNGPLVLLIYLLVLALSFLTYTLPVCIGILSFIAAQFYTFNEPRPLLEILEKSPARLILHKTGMALKLYSLLVLPLLLLALVLHPQVWFVTAYVFAGGLALLIFSVIMKYALYVPNVRMTSAQGILQLIAASCFFNPFQAPLLPVPVVMAVWYYRKALKNLDTYLHAYAG